MKAIYFSGKAGDGKTATALGVGLKLQEEGFKISYFKPLGFQKGVAKKEDDDVLLMREVFKLPFPGDVICPVTLNPHYLTGFLLKGKENVLPLLDESFNRLKEGCDVLLIDGGVAPTPVTTRDLTTLACRSAGEPGSSTSSRRTAISIWTWDCSTASYGNAGRSR